MTPFLFSKGILSWLYIIFHIRKVHIHRKEVFLFIYPEFINFAQIEAYKKFSLNAFYAKDTDLVFVYFYFFSSVRSVKKVKSQKCWTPSKIQNGKSLIKWQNQKLNHIKRKDKNCHTSDWVQAFYPCRQWRIKLNFIACWDL